MQLEQVKENIYKLDNNTYLRKGKKSWRLIYPIKDYATHKFNWRNFLRIDTFSIFFVIMILVVSYAYYHDTKACLDLIQNPALYCSNFINRNITNECSLENQKLGLCTPDIYSNFTFPVFDQEG